MMKKTFLLKSMLLLCALIVGSGSAWATDILTLDCATPAPTGTTSTSMDASDIATFLNSAAGLTDKITCSAKDGDVYKGKGSGGGDIPQQCLKVGKASGGGAFTFTIPNTYDEIGSVEITCYGWKTTSSISINGGTAQTFTTAQVEATKTFDLASATRTITIAVTTSAVCITEIILKSAETGEATTVTIDDSGITNTDVASGTAAGSLSAVVKDASSNTIAAAAVTWTSSKPAVAAINETTGVITLVKKGSTTITANYAGIDGTYLSSSNTYNLTVTNSDANDGTDAHPFTSIEARDALDAGEIDSETDYYVRGYIAKIGTFEDGAITYWISDDGSMTNNVQCYKGKNIGGADFDAATDLEVGDIATVKGKLTIYGGTTYEFTANNEVVSITPRTKVNIATFTATTNPLVLGETETTATTVTNDQAGWTPVSYTYESDDEGVATVDASGVVTAVAKGTANITVTPVVSATDPTYKVGESKSIEIIVKNPSHTASFSVNGVIDEGDNDIVEEGEAITFPANPAAVGGKSFVGWTTTTINVPTDDAPVFATSPTMGTADVTYYAVFADEEETSGWQKMAASEITEAGTYALLTTDGHAFNGTISSGHGQVTSSAFSFVNNVAASAPTGTCEITLTVSGSGFTMYNATNKYLYASKAASGGLAWHDSEDNYWSYNNENWEYSKNYSDSYARLRSYSNATFRTYSTNNGNVLEFAKKTNVTVYSGYFTSIPSEPSNPNVVGTTTTLTTTANMAGWRTFDPGTNKYTTDGTTDVYIATAVTAGTATLTKVASGADAKVPATPVILHQTNGSTTITLTEYAGDVDTPAGNILHVSTADENLGKVYRLGYKSATGVGFYTYSTTSAPAGIIYLNTDGSAHEFLSLDFGEGEGDVTSISEIEKMRDGENEAFFNLAGQRVAQPTKGLYIVNGKKVIIK